MPQTTQETNNAYLTTYHHTYCFSYLWLLQTPSLGSGSGQQDRKAEATKPPKALTQHHFHHILLVKANHKIWPWGEQTPPLDGRAAHTSMGGIVSAHIRKQTGALTHTHRSTYTLQCPGSDSLLLKVPVIAIYSLSLALLSLTHSRIYPFLIFFFLRPEAAARTSLLGNAFAAKCKGNNKFYSQTPWVWLSAPSWASYLTSASFYFFHL